MAEKRILKENGVDIIPITHETAVVTNEGTTINQKYATKEEVNAQIQEESEAINSRVDAIDAKVGDLNALQTSNKSSLTSAINELFQRGNSVKQKLVDTLIAKDVEASTNETFQSLINKFKEAEFKSSLPYAGEVDSWYSIAPLPTAKMHGGAISDGERYIYYIGGGSTINSTAVTVCYRYDVQENTWVTIKNLPTQKSNVAVTFCDGKVYSMGGSSTTGATNSATTPNYCYDPLTDTWTNKGVLPASISWATCDTYNGLIYLIGGRSSSAALKTVYSYDPSSNSYTTKTAITAVRFGHLSAVTPEGYIDIIGGYNTNTYSQSTHYRYTISTDTWSTMTAMAQAQALHDGEYANGKIYWFSGKHTSSSSTTYRFRTYGYSIAGNTNTQYTDFGLDATAVECPIRYSCAVLDNKIYILGGALNDTTATSACHVYIPY